MKDLLKKIRTLFYSKEKMDLLDFLDQNQFEKIEFDQLISKDKTKLLKLWKKEFTENYYFDLYEIELVSNEIYFDRESNGHQNSKFIDSKFIGIGEKCINYRFCLIKAELFSGERTNPQTTLFNNVVQDYLDNIEKNQQRIYNQKQKEKLALETRMRRSITDTIRQNSQINSKDPSVIKLHIK